MDIFYDNFSGCRYSKSDFYASQILGPALFTSMCLYFFDNYIFLTIGYLEGEMNILPLKVKLFKMMELVGQLLVSVVSGFRLL